MAYPELRRKVVSASIALEYCSFALDSTRIVGYSPHVRSGWSVVAKRRTAYLAIGATTVEIAELAIGASA